MVKSKKINKSNYFGSTMIEFLIALALIWVIVAMVQDFRNREVANWLNFSLLLFALAFRGFFSAFTNDYMFLIFGLVGLAISFVLGHILYYARLFAGGDAKLFIALGAVIPFANNFFENNLIFFVFIISLLFGGAIYSLFYSSVLAFRCKKAFIKEFKNIFEKSKSSFYAVLAFSAGFILFFLFTRDLIILLFPIFAISIFFIYIYTKAVEHSCMLIYVPTNKLTVGDWLAEEVKIGDKKIKPYWEGLSEEQVGLLKKNHKGKVLIKQGIPFTPAFLIALLVLIYIQFFKGGDFGLYSFLGF